MNFEDVPAHARRSLRPIVDESFTGLYRWHARRTLRSVAYVRKATGNNALVGVTMSTMVGNGVGYIFYAAVIPPLRGRGIGGAILDDALQALRAKGAREIFACARTRNMPAVRLLLSRHFARTSFPALAFTKGFAEAVRLWVKMVAAPGEKVYVGEFSGQPASQLGTTTSRRL